MVAVDRLLVKCCYTRSLCTFPVDNNNNNSRKISIFLWCETELQRKDLTYLPPLERFQKQGCGGNMQEIDQWCQGLQGTWKFLTDLLQTEAILSEITRIFKMPFWRRNIPHTKYDWNRLSLSLKLVLYKWIQLDLLFFDKQFPSTFRNNLKLTWRGEAVGGGE